MIAYLKGTLIHKTPGSVVVDTGGVGYAAAIPVSSYRQARRDRAAGRAPHPHPPHRRRPRPLRLRLRPRRRTCSSSSSAISGIGPKLAMNVLSGIAPADLEDGRPDERRRPDLARARHRQEDGPAHHHGAPGQAGEEGEAPVGQRLARERRTSSPPCRTWASGGRRPSGPSTRRSTAQARQRASRSSSGSA